MIRTATLLAHAAFVLLVLAGVAWAGTALWLHLSGAIRLDALVLLGLAALAALWLRFFRSRRAGWAVLALGALIVGGWYQTITPMQDRDWAKDVERGVKARVDGSRVTLSDLRDFDWRSENDATERWIDRSVDLNDLQTVDMITSVWDNPDIAHLLVSFGFGAGEHVVFSVEIRREDGEEFNEIGGFFRQFELVLIGATERDIVRLRTDYRKEKVRLYPLALTPEQRRVMFLSYVELAQDLEARARFYNTLLANCTTVVYRLAQSLKPDLPLDWRLLLSGHLPGYLAELGVLDGRTAADGVPITPRTQRPASGQGFSQQIRTP
ncbi:MAG: DUF4105 domain-containing protein [Rhodobacteraceae bacterium]|nr:DUF4105 domain-containing protein [Paracoccaceae bacterium]